MLPNKEAHPQNQQIDQETVNDSRKQISHIFSKNATEYQGIYSVDLIIPNVILKEEDISQIVLHLQSINQQPIIDDCMTGKEAVLKITSSDNHSSNGDAQTDAERQPFSQIISVFFQCLNFNSLKALLLEDVRLYNIEFLSTMRCQNLKILKLEKNGLNCIRSFRKIYLRKLEQLLIFHNRIDDLDPLGRFYFNPNASTLIMIISNNTHKAMISADRHIISKMPIQNCRGLWMCSIGTEAMETRECFKKKIQKDYLKAKGYVNI